MSFTDWLTELKNHPNAQRYRLNYDPRDGTHWSENFLYALSDSGAATRAAQMAKQFGFGKFKVSPAAT